MTPALDNTPVLVVGAGIMGTGIAQVAAQAGHPVMLYDARPNAARTAKSNLETTFKKLVEKKKFTTASAAQTLAQIDPIDNLDAAASAGLVIEAIVEDIEAKRGLLQQLEVIVADDCLLATNTSSISISALANGLAHPERVVGMHFFNPVPLMQLVEVVSGMQTDPAIADAIFRLSRSWGKIPVHARSTPGFIVNRIARPFYAETLALLQEQASTPAVLDACLRAAGFRMGPCELMDLIGHDTNLTVTRSVYEANFFDKRFVPSLLQQSLVDSGLLGRKTGRGFYQYPNPAATTSFTRLDFLPAHSQLWVHGNCAVSAHIARSLDAHDCRYQHITDSDWSGLQVDEAQLRLTDGRPAAQLGRHVAVFDLPLSGQNGSELAWSHAGSADPIWSAAAGDWLAIFGFNAQRIADTPGLVVARTVAMLINEAADAVQQGVCSEADANTAMKLGVNYPAGPFEWLDAWSSAAVIALIDSLDDYYRGERYRVSPWLRQHAWRQT
ncbi:MAG: 3-hydroxyacyl-CoA dehydrogenase [Gammaproteobacteria bacterium]|jgi:3-hydroxybutyryl-CoA dehydrogenase|nr:3-hydroxyacyl-CoA dehydrogenase [Gammaproteobacteria bacterium]